MNPRRYSQIERALHILDKSGNVGILKEDQYLLFLFKKTERIVAALYVMTGLFPDQEPLKWALRSSGSDLLRHTLSFKERATVHSKEFLSDTLGEMAHLFSLMDIAHIADLVSPMNFSIFKKELEVLLDIIEGKWRIASIPASPPFLEEGFFEISAHTFSEPKGDRNELSLGHSFGERKEEPITLGSLLEFERLKRTQKDTTKGQVSVKDTVLNTHQGLPLLKKRIISNQNQMGRPLSNQTKDKRKQQILTTLQHHGKAMIKDFSSVIKGCSEKTIQRLLVEMVQSGVLKREGDRRWSRYSISVTREVL